MNIGDWVRAKPDIELGPLSYERDHPDLARVVRYLVGIPGGVQLDRPLLGYTLWNVSRLERIAVKRIRRNGTKSN